MTGKNKDKFLAILYFLPKDLFKKFPWINSSLCQAYLITSFHPCTFVLGTKHTLCVDEFKFRMQ